MSVGDDSLNMRPLWDALLDVYVEFARVCDRCGLRYFVGEGSAIGALRHKGFIPWDDDFDVIMPRPDYEKFRKVCSKELPSYLKFINYQNTPEFQYTFGKVQDVRKHKVVDVEKEYGSMLPGGIYIDILVVDGMPSSYVARTIYRFKRFMFVCQQRFRTFKFSALKLQGRVLWTLGALASVFHPSETWPDLARRFELFMMSVPFETADSTWRDAATYRTVRLSYPRNVWDGEVKVEFAGLSVPLPAGYDAYLRAQYGDYMQPPPIGHRHTTHQNRARCPWWLGPTSEASIE